MRKKKIVVRNIKNKQYKYLWSKMQRKDVIIRAWMNLRKGKTKRAEVKKIDENLDEEAEKMRQMIKETVEENPDCGYNPPKVRATKMVNEHGKKRIAHLADVIEQWYFHVIVEVLKPIVTRRLHPNVCGCIPGRGAHSGKKIIERWIGDGVKYFYKADVRHFYDSLQIAVVIRALQRDIADERFLYCIRKIYRYQKRGILIGLYISPWIANYVLSYLDEAIESTGARLMRYMDDIVVATMSKKLAHMVHDIACRTLSYLRLKLKRTYQVFRFDFKDKGRPLDFMGFLFFRNRTVIRKSILLRATRCARRLKRAKDEGRRFFAGMVRGMVSRMGWFCYTASYDCYLRFIKPFVNIGTLKRIVSKLDKEVYHEEFERRALLIGA